MNGDTDTTEEFIGEEKRVSTLRRDLNQIVRDAKGDFSPTKILGYCGQVLCGYLLLHHAEKIIAHWDALLVLLVGMIAPELIKRIVNFKYPAAQ